MKTKWILSLLPALMVTTAHADMVTKQAGRAADQKLKVKKSGVPQYEVYQKTKKGTQTEVSRVSNIPRLDLGQEPTMNAADVKPVELPPAKNVQLGAFQKRPAVPEISIDKFKSWGSPTQISEAKKLADPNKVVTLPSFTEPVLVADPIPTQPALNQVEIKDLSPVELKLLQALIFLQIQKNYPMAIGLFAELLDEAPQYKTEATYNLALTSLGLGLYSEYKHQMSKVLNEAGPEWQKRAITSLVANAASGDLALVGLVDPKIEKLKVTLEKADQYQMNRAKYYQGQDKMTEAFAAVDQIAPDSSLYLDSQFLKSVLQYRTGQVQEAVATMSVTLDALEKLKPVPELKTVAALTLARLYFQTGDYKTSYQIYLKVDKAHPEFPQAMIEQAWAQTLAGDYEGAAGNMFSLHTDFFKNIFTPESYVVRTVSYLNLCQYGDGARVVQDLRRRYTPVQKQLATYQSAHPQPTDYYETVKKFTKDPSSKEIDGLPRTFIWTLARHPNFMTEQQNINSLEEQIARYNKVTMDLINREKFLLSEQNTLRTKIVAARKGLKPGETNDDVQKLEKRLLSYKVQHFIVKKARTSIKDLRAAGLTRIEKEKTDRKALASKALSNRFNSMLGNLSSSLDQADVLQYELYAGAGEHLRYQAAGGEFKPTEADGLKPEANKALNWEFKGEVWEDELGHYRSSLKNVCPQTEGSGQEQVTQVEK